MNFVLTSFVSLLGRVVPVPGMGDSISEGVVEEFVKGMLFPVFLLLCFPLFLQVPESSSKQTKSSQGLRLKKSPSISPLQLLVLSRVTLPPKETPLRSEPTSTSSILMPQADLLQQRQLLQRLPKLRPQRPLRQQPQSQPHHQRQPPLLPLKINQLSMPSLKVVIWFTEISSTSVLPFLLQRVLLSQSSEIAKILTCNTSRKSLPL